MSKTKDTQVKKRGDSPLSTFALISELLNQHRFVNVLIILLGVSFLISAVIFSIDQFRSSWYSINFSKLDNGLLWTIIFIGLDLLRWLSIFALGMFTLVMIVTPENSRISNSLSAIVFQLSVFLVIIMGLLIGLQNLVFYSVIGWGNLHVNKIGEGIFLFLMWIAAIIIVLGSKFQSAVKTAILESIFNISLIMLPVSWTIALSLGGFMNNPQWFNIGVTLSSLLIFILGVDELRGKPSLYISLVATFRVLETGHASLKLLQKRSAETLASALKMYTNMPIEQQESLTKWILDNNKPSFINRFWAIAKIAVSTILLTVLVQEPAIIVFKWLLKTLFGFSY